MNEQRDHALGAALRELDLPMERADFWDELGRDLDRIELLGQVEPWSSDRSGDAVFSDEPPRVNSVAFDLGAEPDIERPTVHRRVAALAAVLVLVVVGLAVYVAFFGESDPRFQGPVATVQTLPQVIETPATAEVAAATPDIDFDNLTYPSLWVDEDVTLVDGVWTETATDDRASVTRIWLDQVDVFGSDGVVAFVYLRTDPGGSGTFYDVYAVTRFDGKLVVSQPAPLGDRITNRSWTASVSNDGAGSLKVTFTNRDGATHIADFVLDGTELVVQPETLGILGDVNFSDDISYPTDRIPGDVNLSGGEWTEPGVSGGSPTMKFRLEEVTFSNVVQPLALVLLAIETEGSGPFYDLYVATADGEQISVSQPLFLGDRLRNISTQQASSGELGVDSVVVSFVDTDGINHLDQYKIEDGELVAVVSRSGLGQVGR